MNIVTKILGGIYTVLLDNNELVECSVRKNAKKLRIVVGDNVELEENDYDKGKYIITRVLPRKNSLIRPPLANLDKLLILIAPSPEPDLLLVDKLLIYSALNSIEPIIVLNKSDIADDNFISSIKAQYNFIDVIIVSAKNNTNINTLTSKINNRFSAVCGQSAVGKSSLLNALIPNIDLDTQGLSEKIGRGKHTTRVNEVHIFKDLRIVDTPGFSSLELDLDYRELHLFYPEFDEYLGKCKYLDCSHIKEGKDCEIVKNVENSTINKDRYLRYIDLYNKLKKEWDSKYD